MTHFRTPRVCHCGSGLISHELVDARGISCGLVCEKCEASRRAKYRPEIFDNATYETDDTVEPEDY